MAEITAALVKELRDQTGAGMMDCKQALSESGGDIEQAVDWLRTKGLSKAAKKSGRVASEGLVGIATGDGIGAMVEVNSETDFVARNEAFQTLVANIAKLALEGDGTLEGLLAADYPGTGRNVADEVTHQIATIGENMSLRRVAKLEAPGGVVASYMHNQIAPDLGKIGVLVAIEAADKAKAEELGKQVAMHIAATKPESLSTSDLDPELVERERQVLSEQARESGKPEDIIGKMVEGRLRKFYEEVVLLEQTFVIDGENKVGKVVEEAGVGLSAFVRFGLGEGIEKEEEDFAAEVKAQIGS